jgi:hypothetical protein
MLVRLSGFFRLLLNEAVTSEAAEEDVIEAAAPDQATPLEAEDDAVDAIYQAWASDLYDNPLEDLQSFIVKNKKEDIREIYAKTVVFVQSSGMGKSRLAKEYGRRICLMVSYCLRRKGDFARHFI